MEGPRHHVRQCARQGRAEPVHRDGQAQQTLEPQLGDGGPPVGESAREHLVKHDAQRIDVARWTQRVAQQLVWAHVGQGAWLERVGCQERSHVVRYSDVEQLHVAPWTQHDVLRFEVGVENADPMQMVQRVRHGAQYTYGLVELEGYGMLQTP